MSQPDIAPAAQRLAEENNVNWRALRGSGEGGSVLERDVLEYLARVVRGEEAADPTPEPLPEGLSAWPEEPERRREDAAGQDFFSAPFSKPVPRPEAAPTAEPDEEAASPWVLNEPAKLPPAEPEPEAPTFGFAGAFSAPQAGTAAEEPTRVPPVGRESDAPSAAGVPEAVHKAALTELETLKDRLAALEAERQRHVDELHQLSRLQETIALHKNESAKVGALQREVEGLKERLAQAQAEAQRAGELEAQLRDLGARLTRARTFRERAKAEFERVVADNARLEHELAALKNRPRRRPWGRAS
jgi:hypothetical protein